MSYSFIPGKEYTRKDIFRTIGLPEDTKGGNWFTGYNEYKGDFFIFCTLDGPGRTGHTMAQYVRFVNLASRNHMVKLVKIISIFII